jgi:hypothetical protein
MRYRDIENLPEDDPRVAEFWKEVQKMEAMYIAEQFTYNLDDEQSLDYFNRFIAGDRRV